MNFDSKLNIVKKVAADDVYSLCDLSDPDGVLHGAAALRVGVSADEVLEENLGVPEVGGLVVVGLPVHKLKSILEVLVPPDEPLEVCIEPQRYQGA